jgi:hypothetical protein
VLKYPLSDTSFPSEVIGVWKTPHGIPQSAGSHARRAWCGGEWMIAMSAGCAVPMMTIGKKRPTAQVAIATRYVSRVRSAEAAAMMMATVESVDCPSTVVRQPRAPRCRQVRRRRGDGSELACKTTRDWDKRSRHKKDTK